MPGQDEERKARSGSGFQNRDDQEGYEAETQESQLVRGGAKFFQHWLGVTSIK